MQCHNCLRLLSFGIRHECSPCFDFMLCPLYSSRGPRAAEARTKDGASVAVFWAPFAEPSAEEGEERAGTGAQRVKRIKAKVQWTFAPLNGLATDAGPRACKQEQGQRSAARRASGPGTGLRRAKMTVQWTVIPSNGLATDGEPRACKQEQGERRAARRAAGPGTGNVPCLDPLRRLRREGHPLFLRAMAQAQMALGTLAETKVPRLPGRDPADISRRVGDTIHPSYGGETPVVINRRE